jgi:glycosyltransferase involved in cell wall biosynthesis
MNLFIIPSWYPSHAQPISGIFTQVQAEAIAHLRKDINVIVSTWGHHESEISLQKPWRIFKVLLWRLRLKKGRISRRDVFEIFTPTLTWSRRLPFGGAARLLYPNRTNLQLAIQEFGSIDVIHAHVSYPAGYVAAILSSEFQIPYVLTEHMSPFPFTSLTRKGKPLPEIDRAFNDAAATIAVSQSLANRLISFGYQKPEIIPNLVDERSFSLGEASPDHCVFLTLCGLSEQKGIDVLLKAIAIWNPPPDRYEFRIGGDGPMRRTYEALSIRLGIDDRVRWLGPIGRDRAPLLFRDCHIFVIWQTVDCNTLWWA